MRYDLLVVRQVVRLEPGRHLKHGGTTSCILAPARATFTREDRVDGGRLLVAAPASHPAPKWLLLEVLLLLDEPLFLLALTLGLHLLQFVEVGVPVKLNAGRGSA